MDVREKLVELLIKSGEICYSHTAEELASYLTAHGVTVQEWIPVSDPPKEKGRYWCNVKSFSFPGRYYQTVLKWDDGFIEGRIYTDDVTHWMPLPQLPKGNNYE